MMKKILLALCSLFMLFSCKADEDEYVSNCVLIVNKTDCRLVFSTDNNWGYIISDGYNYHDYDYYPEKGFTIEPQGEYRCQHDNVWLYEPVQCGPMEMVLECNGKTIHFVRNDDSVFKNPTSGQNWFVQPRAKKSEPNLYIYMITDEHLEKWFGN